MHVLFCSTVFFIGLPCDSTWTIKGLVKVLFLIPSCIAKLVTSTVLNRSFCMASKINFRHAYLVEHFRCTFCSVVQYFSLAYLVIALGL